MAERQMIAVARGLAPLDVAALTLHHEAGGERLVGLIALAAVLRNRVAWGRWGPTLVEVCLAPKQFSCWRAGGGNANYLALERNAGRIRDGARPPEMALAYAVAEAIFDDGLPDPTNGADHYYAPRAMRPAGATPPWIVIGDVRTNTRRELTPTAVIGGHRFYRLRAD